MAPVRRKKAGEPPAVPPEDLHGAATGGAQGAPAASPVTPSSDAIFTWIRDQEEVLHRLRRAAADDSVPQAYLFHGPRGVGKTRTAIGLAQMLNCTGATRPCGACLPCRKLGRLQHPDLRLLFPTTREEDGRPEEIAKKLEDYGGDRYHLLDFARNASIGIERIRELKAEAAMSLSEGRRRIFIITDAVRLTEDAAQSALKLIEEPPPATHMVLVAEEPAALLPTIVSRCQQVRFRPLRGETIEGVLSSQAGYDPGSARLIAALADGSLGRALGLREETSIIKTRDRAVELLHVRPDPGQIQDKVREWSRNLDPNTARRTVELLLMWCHDLLAVRYNLPEESLCNIDRREELCRQAEGLTIRSIRVRIEALEEMLSAIDRNVHPPLALHEMLFRLAGAAGETLRSPI